MEHYCAVKGTIQIGKIHASNIGGCILSFRRLHLSDQTAASLGIGFDVRGIQSRRGVFYLFFDSALDLARTGCRRFYSSTKSDAFDGSGGSPLRFRMSVMTWPTRDCGTGAQCANSNPQNARPCDAPRITSERSKVSAVGSSPTTYTRCPR